MAPDDPPPKVYGFKERKFTRDNPTASAAPPVPTAKELAIMAGHKTAPAKPELAAADRAKKSDPNDVYAVLDQNRAVEQQHGLGEVQIRKKKSRRKRDYWLLLVGGNLLTVGTVAVLQFNVISLIYGLAGIVIFSISLTWIMWFIMEDY